MDISHFPIITREDVAKWYSIKTSGLRKRLAKTPDPLHLANRALTIDDIKSVIKKLGEPPFIPAELKCIIYT